MTAEFNRKKVNLPYTVAIIKPDVAENDALLQDLLTMIENEGFQIITMIKRELTKEEILNLYYDLREKDFYEKLERYLRNGECMVMMLTHEKHDPIAKWRTMMGPADPVEAKKTDPKSLRALYGKDALRNGFHGSQNSSLASKERDIFKFFIPQKEPDFQLDKYLIEYDKLIKFLYPPNLEHPNVTGRLDLFAMYGPVIQCYNVEDLCKSCIKIGRDYLKNAQSKRLQNEIHTLGIKQSKTANKDAYLSKTLNSANPSKITISPLRILDEGALKDLETSLCIDCKEKADKSVRLLSGRHQQHIVTETEIKELIYEVNKKELLDKLIAEKGSVAKMIIETLEIVEPKEIQYTKDHIRQLIRTLDSDYYGRYKFQEMQNLILEDRRTRMNAWVAKIVGKPIDRFLNPKLLDQTVPPEERKNPGSLHFTLSRTEPISMLIKPVNLNAKTTTLPPSIVDKPKLQPNEEKIVLFKMLHRNTTNILSVDNLNDNSFATNIFLLRKNYNPGRNGNWDNYSSLKRCNRGTYVKTTKDEKPNKSEFEY